LRLAKRPGTAESGSDVLRLDQPLAPHFFERKKMTERYFIKRLERSDIRQIKSMLYSIVMGIWMMTTLLGLVIMGLAILILK
jgi:hypothetical protein